MWTNWRPATVDADFATIQAMHANLVRVNVFPGVFGYPTPSPTMMAELASVVQMAANHGLHVDLELFDWFPTYTDIAGSKQWARAVMAPFAGDPRIAFICLQNEIPLATNPAAVTWAQQMVPYLRSIDGGLPLTISSPGGNTLTGDLQTLVNDFPPGSGLDFYDYHYYSAPELAHAAIAQAQTVARGVALYIGETGHTTMVTDTVNGVESVQAAHDAYQDHYLRSVQLAAQQLGVGAASPWLFTDFTPGAIPPISPGTNVPREYDMGLLRMDGSAKPAAASLSAYYGTGTVDPSYNQGFETSLISGTVALPTEWRLGSSGTARFAIDTSVAHSGLASLSISDAMTDTTGSPQIFVDPIDQNIVPGQTYTFSAWAQGLNATGSSHLTLFWRDINGNTISSMMSPNITRGTTSWTQLSVSAVAPSAAVAVRLALTSANNAGTVWFDDVSFS
jgi:hypothetical protein